MVIVIYLDIIFGINVLFNFLVLMLTNYIAKAGTKNTRILIAAVFASLIVPIQFMIPDPLVHSLIFKWSYALLIILAAFGYNGFYIYVKRFSTFLFIMFTVGGGLFGVQLMVRESGMLHNNLLVFVKNMNGEPISLVLLFLCFPAVLIFMKGKMDRHVKDKFKFDQIYQVSIELDGIIKSTKGYIDSGNQLTDTFSGRPVVVCDSYFLQQLFNEDEWREIVACVNNGGYDQFPEKIEKRISIVPYQGVGGSSGLLYAFKPDKLMVDYEGSKLETDKVLIGIQTSELTVDRSYHCLLHPDLIQLKMKQSA